MTALKPLETLRVKGMEAGVYATNRLCAHPECSEPVPDRGHHIFPRSQIGNGLYFVQAWGADGKEMFDHPIPHVTGLCRTHHDAVEHHDAWIKLEDGVFAWYDRVGEEEFRRDPQYRPLDTIDAEWKLVGPLDPQPAGREKVHKPKRSRLKGDDLAKRKTVSVRLPEGVDGAYWQELLDEAQAVELAQPDTKFDAALGEITTGKLIVAVFERFTGRV